VKKAVTGQQASGLNTHLPAEVARVNLPEFLPGPPSFLVPALVATDAFSLLAALFLAWQTRLHVLPLIVPSLYPRDLPLDFFHHLAWVVSIVIVYFTIEGLYFLRLPFWRETRRLCKVVSLSFLLILAAISLGKMSSEFSRTVLVLCCLFALVLMPLGRLGAKTLLWRWGLWARPVLILGAGKTGELVAQALARDRYLGYQVYGFLDDDPAKKNVKVNGNHFPVLGGFKDWEEVMAHSKVRDLIVAAPGMPSTRLVDLVNRLQRTASSVLVIPDLFGLPVAGVKADYFFDEQILSFRLHNNLANPFNRAMKRAFDLTAGLLVFLCALPLFLAIALAIKLDSPGPVLFFHRRTGFRGREFTCYKFRTMVANAQEALTELLKTNPRLQQEWENHYKLKNDPRVTRVGKFLRRTSLDELPQLINVLKGEMSLVGPRPVTEKEIAHFGAYGEDYLLVRPGITGLWQVSGRADVDYRRRIRLESWYVRNWSLWLDVTLLIRTVAVVLARRGAY